LSQLLEFFAGFVTEFRAFIAEVETSAVQALNNFASVSPTFWGQNLTTFTPNFIRGTFRMPSHSVQIFPIVLVGSVYASGATIETTSTN